MYTPTIVTKIHIKFIAVFSGSHVTANKAKIMTHINGTKPRRMKRICSFNQSLILFITVHFSMAISNVLIIFSSSFIWRLVQNESYPSMLVSLKSLICEVKSNCDWPCKASCNKCDKILTISAMNIFYLSIDRKNV